MTDGNDTRPEADEDQDDDATPAEFIDRPENLPGEQLDSDDTDRSPRRGG